MGGPADMKDEGEDLNEKFIHMKKKEMGEKDEKEQLSPHQIYNKITAFGDSLL